MLVGRFCAGSVCQWQKSPQRVEISNCHLLKQEAKLASKLVGWLCASATPVVPSPEAFSLLLFLLG